MTFDPHRFTEKKKQERQQQGKANPKSGNGKPERPKSAPAIMTSKELLAWKFPDPRFVIPDLLCEGLSILGGKPKLGKSWMTYDWAVAVTTSGIACGSIPCDQGDALVLALEDSPRRMQQRLRKLGASGSDALTIATNWPRIDEGGLEAINAWLDIHEDCRLVVVDTLRRFRARCRTADVYQAEADALEFLQRLAGDRGIAIVVVLHVRKALADDWIDTISGSVGSTGAADSILVLKRERGQADAFLLGTGRDLPDFEKPLKFDEASCRWSVLDISPEEARATSDQAAIIQLLRSMGNAGLMRSQIAAALDRSKTAVSHMLTRMEAAGIVERTNGSLWRLTV